VYVLPHWRNKYIYIYISMFPGKLIYILRITYITTTPARTSAVSKKTIKKNNNYRSTNSDLLFIILTLVVG